MSNGHKKSKFVRNSSHHYQDTNNQYQNLNQSNSNSKSDNEEIKQFQSPTQKLKPHFSGVEMNNPGNHIRRRQGYKHTTKMSMLKNISNHDLQRVTSIVKICKGIKAKKQDSTFSKISNAFWSVPKDNSVDKIPFEYLKCNFGWPGVLIVDDQFINRMILKEFGLRYGFECDEAENGQVAVDMYN